MRPRGPGNEDGPREDACGREALGTRMEAKTHSRTQSPSYARCDEGLWPNPKPETIKTW